MKPGYRLATVSCFLGITVQAAVCNITAVLFVPLMRLYGLNFAHLGMLVAINFISQMLADIIFSGLIDRIGYKRLVTPTAFICLAALVLFASSPVFGGWLFTALVVATIMFSFASGLMEILLSNIIASIPFENKGPVMSLMHSFYAWGVVATVGITTLCLRLFGTEHWQLIVLGWCLLPAIAGIMFLKADFPDTPHEISGKIVKSVARTPFYIFAMLAIFFGAATEVTVSQWASSFLEYSLGIPKVNGDLLGLCGFAMMLGLGRLLHGILGKRVNLQKTLILCSSLAVLCYLLMALSPYPIINLIACAVCGLGASLLWPGTITISAERFPLSGGWMLATLAIAGDFGALVGPSLNTAVISAGDSFGLNGLFSSLFSVSSEQAGMRAGFLLSAVFPLITAICHSVLLKMNTKEKKG